MLLSTVEIGKVDEVHMIISRNPDENYTLTKLARISGMNARALTSAFKEVHAVDIKEFMLSNRMHYARQLLATDKSIKEICALAGYASVASFNKSFKRFHGFPPAQYRKTRKTFNLSDREMRKTDD